MSLINRATLGFIYKDGEWPPKRSPLTRGGGGWHKYGNYWVSTSLEDLLVYLPRFPIWLLSVVGVKWAQKRIGHALGFSSCAHCGMPWKYVKGKDIAYSEDSGMFPICVDCFDSLEVGQIDRYIVQLVMSWIEVGQRYQLSWGKEQSPEEVIQAAKAEIRRMKGIHSV